MPRGLNIKNQIFKLHLHQLGLPTVTTHTVASSALSHQLEAEIGKVEYQKKHHLHSPYSGVTWVITYCYHLYITAAERGYTL